MIHARGITARPETLRERRWHLPGTCHSCLHPILLPVVPKIIAFFFSAARQSVSSFDIFWTKTRLQLPFKSLPFCVTAGLCSPVWLFAVLLGMSKGHWSVDQPESHNAHTLSLSLLSTALTINDTAILLKTIYHRHQILFERLADPALYPRRLARRRQSYLVAPSRAIIFFSPEITGE